MNVKENKEKIGEIALWASKEAELKKMYEKMSAEWKEIAFEVLPYKDNKDYFVIGSTEELEDVLENSIMQLSSII